MAIGMDAMLAKIEDRQWAPADIGWDPGFATQYLRQMRDFRFGDYDAVARDLHTGIGTRIRT